MLAHAPQQQSHASPPFGVRALRWSWYLLLLWFPWQLIGGGIAIGLTSLAGGDFTAGESVPGYVYPALYVWMIAPLVASIVLGMLGWVKGHKPVAVVPAIVSVIWIGALSVFGAEQFFGI